MSEIEKDKKRPAFLLSPAFREISRKAFEKHKGSPEVSARDNFEQKIRELQNEMAGRKIIYLDTNHWVNMRHVIMRSPHEKSEYREILELLENLHKQKLVCCPISFWLFSELVKQSDPVTRLQTARLMDRFSDGVCFQFPLDLARTELRHFLLRQVAAKIRALNPWVWAKIGFWVGELLPTLSSIPNAKNNLIQKAWTDLMWAVGLEQIVEQIKPFDAGSDFWVKYAAASNADAVFYRSSNLNYSKVLEREKALLMRKLIAEELPSIGQEMWDAFPEVRDPSNLPQPTESDYSPFNFPSLQILAGINAADMLSSKKFDSHDMLDFRHAAMAIPYCDVVCCDHPMATRLRNKPCEFGKIYGTQILGRHGAILDYLKGLAR